MKEFLEKILRQNVIMTDNKEVYKKLPLVYRGRYDIFTVETNGALWMAIHPKDDVGLVMLRRDRAGIEKMTGLNCAIFLDRTTFYIKEKMMGVSYRENPDISLDDLRYVRIIHYNFNGQLQEGELVRDICANVKFYDGWEE